MSKGGLILAVDCARGLSVLLRQQPDAIVLVADSREDIPRVMFEEMKQASDNTKPSRGPVSRRKWPVRR